jgi:hypothetical protein
MEVWVKLSTRKNAFAIKIPADSRICEFKKLVLQECPKAMNHIDASDLDIFPCKETCDSLPVSSLVLECLEKWPIAVVGDVESAWILHVPSLQDLELLADRKFN